MKYIAFTLLAFLLTANPLLGQNWVQDSVNTTPSYAQDVYYSLENGTVASANRTNWHLAFSIDATSAISANTAGLVDVYLAAQDTASFANLDTTGILTENNELYNAMTSWLGGALNSMADTTLFEDIGWGVYDFDGSIGGIPHVIWGAKTFVAAVRDTGGGVAFYKKFFVRKRQSGVYTVVHSNLDGSNQSTTDINTANYSGKNFAYLAFTPSGAQTLDREPTDSWDLVFTKYTDPDFNGVMAYDLTTVLTNNGLRTHQLENPADPDAISDTTPGQFFSEDINVIGHDWKNFDNTNFSWSVESDWYYIVSGAQSGSWVVNFTDFGGSRTGVYYFRKKSLTDGTTSISEQTAIQGFTAYPNPSTGPVNLAFGITTGERSAQLLVVDPLGRVARQLNLNLAPGELQTQQVDLSNLDPGYYQLVLQTPQGRAAQPLLLNR